MDEERRRSFGGVAELYDRSRPSYPAGLVDEVLEFAGAGTGDRALEIGAGTGKATVLFAERGLHVVGLEPSAEMAAIARRNCAPHANVRIEEAEFERWEPNGRRFELVFSAQAWHWVAPDVRYVHAGAALKPGGALAVFWNVTDWARTPLRAALLTAYERVAPNFRQQPGPIHPATGLDPHMLGDFTTELEQVAGFTDPQVRSYDWSAEYTTAEYLELMQTHSDHILLAEGELAALLEAVAEVLEAGGGRLRLEYVATLGLARAT